jgi:hypothetical protein
MIVAKRVLLVEGNDDFHVLSSLFKHHNIPDAFRLNETGGIDRLLETFPVQLKATAIERVGIVVDADLSIADRWRAIQGILRSAGFAHVPNTPDEQGTIITQSNKPDVGIWLMPDNRLPGLVEDFAACLIPLDDRLSQLALQAIDAIPVNDRRFSDIHRSKRPYSHMASLASRPRHSDGSGYYQKVLGRQCAERSQFSSLGGSPAPSMTQMHAATHSSASRRSAE